MVDITTFGNIMKQKKNGNIQLKNVIVRITKIPSGTIKKSSRQKISALKVKRRQSASVVVTIKQYTDEHEKI